MSASYSRAAPRTTVLAAPDLFAIPPQSARYTACSGVRHQRLDGPTAAFNVAKRKQKANAPQVARLHTPTTSTSLRTYSRSDGKDTRQAPPMTLSRIPFEAATGEYIARRDITVYHAYLCHRNTLAYATPRNATKGLHVRRGFSRTCNQPRQIDTTYCHGGPENFWLIAPTHVQYCILRRTVITTRHCTYYCTIVKE